MEINETGILKRVILSSTSGDRGLFGRIREQCIRGCTIVSSIGSAVLALAAAMVLSACASGEKDPQANYDLMKDITYHPVTEGTGIFRIEASSG